MPRISKLKLAPINTSDKDIGEQIAHFRKTAGLTQIELAERMGLTQSLISSYERGVLRLNAEMIIRFSQELNVSSDEILLLDSNDKEKTSKISLKVLKRAVKIDKLPTGEQKALFKTIDKYIKVEDKE